MEMNTIHQWFLGSREAQVLMAAVKLQIFDHLPGTMPVLKKKLGADAEALTGVMNALLAIRLVTRKGSTWGNTPLSTQLRRDAPVPHWAMIMHQEKLRRSWTRMPEMVKKGRSRMTKMPEEKGEHEWFIGSMNVMGMEKSRSFWKTVSPKGSDLHLLDLGGGGGRYAATALTVFPKVIGRATVFDDPESKPWYTRIKKELPKPLQDKFHFIAGDFLADPVKGKYDLVLASNIFHIFNDRQSLEILKKARKAVSDKGILLVQDWFSEKEASPWPSLFHLNMLLNTPTGKVHDKSEFVHLAGKAKFELTAYKPLPMEARVAIFRAV